MLPFRLLGADTKKEGPRVSGVHSEVHGWMEQRPVRQPQLSDQPGWETDSS